MGVEIKAKDRPRTSGHEGKTDRRTVAWRVGVKKTRA